MVMVFERVLGRLVKNNVMSNATLAFQARVMIFDNGALALQSCKDVENGVIVRPT